MTLSGCGDDDGAADDSQPEPDSGTDDATDDDTDDSQPTTDDGDEIDSGMTDDMITDELDDDVVTDEETDDSMEDDTPDDGDAGMEPDASPGDDEDSGTDDGPSEPPDSGMMGPDTGTDDEPGCDDVVCCDGGTCPPEMEAGMCEPLTEPLVTGGEPMGDAGADAGAGPATCWPACIAELEALCAPSGACNVEYGSYDTVACWDNGVDTDIVFAYGDGFDFQVTSQISVGGELCYGAHVGVTQGLGQEYTWTDNCGTVVATGFADESDFGLVSVTCVDTDEVTIVDLGTAACAPYAEGVVSVGVCDDNVGCDE